MNEEYLKGLHGHLEIKDDYDTWVSAIKDNEEYLLGLHGHLGIKDDYDTWVSAIGLKKKDDTASAPPTEDATTTLVSEEVEETTPSGSSALQDQPLPTDATDTAQIPTEEIDVEATETIQQKDLTSQYAERVLNSRTSTRKNEDGSESTVLMAQSDNYAYPTLFQEDDGTWTELEPDAAFERAKKEDEVYVFENEEEAMRFAEGAWKETEVSLKDINTELAATEKQLDDRLEKIDKDIISREEEVVVPELQKEYAGYGFLFEQEGVGDAMKVIAPNDKEISIDLDPWTEKGAEQEANRLKQFLKSNAGEYEDISVEDIYEASKQGEKEFVKYYNEDIIQAQEESLTGQLDSIRTVALETDQQWKDLIKDAESISPQTSPEELRALQQRENQLKIKTSALQQSSQDVNEMQIKLNEIAGEYTALKAQEGTWVESWWKSFVGTYDSKNSAITGGIIDIMTSVLPEDMLSAEKRKESESQLEYRDKLSKQLKAEMKPAIRTALQDVLTTDITNEYQEKFMKTTWGMVSTSLAQMVAHMGSTIGSGSKGMAVSFGLQIMDDVYKEMESEEFDDVSEFEKKGIGTLIAATSGILETFGVSKMLNKSGLAKSVLLKVLGKVGSKASYETIEKAINKEVNSLVAKGALRVLGSSIVEAETEVAQEGMERGYKAIYNSMKEKDLFSEESTQITWSHLGQAAKLGALGGGIFGGVTASYQAYQENSVNKLNNQQFEFVKDLVTNSKARELYAQRLKTEIISGSITKKEASKRLAGVRDMASIFEQIPTNLSESAQKESFVLLKEKRTLEQEIAGKDESLITTEKNRITDIDNKLKEISITKTEKDAIQEPSTESVDVREQARDGEEVGVRDTKGQEVTEEVTDEVTEEVGKAPEVEVKEEVTPTEEKEPSPETQKGKVEVEREIKKIDKELEAEEATLAELKKEEVKEEVEVEETGDTKISSGDTYSMPDKNGVFAKEFANTSKRGAFIINEKGEVSITPGAGTYLGRILGRFESYLKDTFEITRESRNMLDNNFDSITGIVVKKNAKVDSNGKIIEKGEIEFVADQSGIIYGKKSAAKKKVAQKKPVDTKAISESETRIDELKRRRKEEEGKLKAKPTTEVTPEQRAEQADKDIAEGLDDLMNAIGGKLNIIGEERADAIKAFQKILNGLATKLQLKGEALWSEFLKTLKTKNLDESSLEAMGIAKKDILQQEPSKERVDKIIEGIKEKIKKRKFGKDTNPEVILEAAEGYLQGTKFYEEATDIQREDAVRELRSSLGIKSKKAPSAKKILGQPPRKKVLIDDVAERKRYWKGIEKAIKEAKKDLNTKRQELAENIKELKRKGKINTIQARAMLNKISIVNLDNPKAVEEFIKYVDKIYQNAEYADKIIQAKDIRRKIKKGSKSKDKDASLVELAKEFSELDPRFIEDIDGYLEIAKSVLEGVKSSRIKGTNVQWRTSPEIVKVKDYIENNIESQEKQLLDLKRQEFEALTGIEASELSYDQMMEMMPKEEDISEKKEALIEKNIKKAFSVYTPLVEHILRTGKDRITGEQVDLTTQEKKLVKDFINMDLSDLSIKEGIAAVDALNNFITNYTTNGMQATVDLYKGAKKVRQLVADGVKSLPLRLFGVKYIGRLTAKEITSLPILFERLFKGTNAGLKVMQEMGITAVMKGSAKATTETTNIIEEYSNKFKKTKPNNEAFNTSYNITERGIIGFMRRTIIGTASQQKEEFNRRKDLIEESIEVLEQGNAQEKVKAKEYKKVYDAVLKNTTSVEQLDAKVSPENLEAVKWWNKKWEKYHPDLANVSLNVYNRKLGKDENYIPDSFKRVEEQPVDFDWDESAFIGAQNVLYKKKTGVLEEATRPPRLPRDASGKNITRYVSLDFDTNNAAILKSALVDINTAGAIRQIKGFIEDPAFKKLIPFKEDRDMVTNRVKGYVRRVRGKDMNITSDERLGNKIINTIAGLAVSRVLGGLTQPIKQVIPASINTLINAGKLNLDLMMDKSVQNFIDNSGYSIGNRGMGSETTLDNINRALEEAQKGPLRNFVSILDDTNRWWLEMFLVKPDVWIARTSWITYYTQSLQKQGIDTDGIDWNTHKINTEAGDYAQQQVDRQQNVSDADLQGDFMTSKKPGVQLARKVLIPFMNFVLNQKARMYSDVITATSKTASIEDKKLALRSLSGLLAETAIFNALSYGITNLLYNWAKDIMDYDEDKEEEEKRLRNKEKGIATNITKDLLSPFPTVGDQLTTEGVNFLLNKIQEDLPEDEVFNLFTPREKSFLESLGVLGMTVEKIVETKEIINMATKGVSTTEFLGKKTEKELSRKAQNLMKKVVPFAILYNIGLLPSEVGSELRYLTKLAKKTATKKSTKKSKPVGGFKEKSFKEKGFKEKSFKEKKFKEKTFN